MVFAGCVEGLKNVAQSLAISGILQFKRAAISNTIVDAGLGEVVYTGFAPTVSTAALPITLVEPFTGSVIYTSLPITVTSLPPLSLEFTTTQITSVGDTPWRVTYSVYTISNVLLYTVSQNINGGAGTFTATTRYGDSTHTADHVEVQVVRLTETFGTPPRNNRTNDAGNVFWNIVNGFGTTVVGSSSFISNRTFNQIVTVNGIESGDEIYVEIWEG